MTTRTILLIVALAVPARALAQNPDAARLSGRWAGTGDFFNRDLAGRLGPIPIQLEFRSGELVGGSVGDASPGRTRVGGSKRMLQLGSKLTGRIGPAKELDKDYFVLLITNVTDTVLTAEFHLKSNRVFDARVREGRVQLRRVP